MIKQTTLKSKGGRIEAKTFNESSRQNNGNL